LSRDYQAILKGSEVRWTKVCQGLAQRSTQVSVAGEDLAARYQLAQQMFPSQKKGVEDSELFAAML
jgi:hypothetical protein